MLNELLAKSILLANLPVYLGLTLNKSVRLLLYKPKHSFIYLLYIVQFQFENGLTG